MNITRDCERLLRKLSLSSARRQKRKREWNCLWRVPQQVKAAEKMQNTAKIAQLAARKILTNDEVTEIEFRILID